MTALQEGIDVFLRLLVLFHNAFVNFGRNQEGFSIAFPDGIIPISEKNAQYIVLMYNADESSKKELWTNLEYMVEALTIPIVENSDMTDDEVYAILKLPEDVSQCSRDLIEQFIVK